MIIGDFVFVNPSTSSSGGYGFITEINNREDNDSINNYSIFYSVTRTTEKCINPARVRISNIASTTGTTRTRSGATSQPNIRASTGRPTTQRPALSSLQNGLNQSFSHRHKSNKPHPLIQYLDSKRNSPKGWLLEQERRSNPSAINLKQKKQMRKKLDRNASGPTQWLTIFLHSQ